METDDKTFEWKPAMAYVGQPFAGVQIIEDIHCTETLRFPRLPKSRKRRIRDKWRKKYPQFRTVPARHMYRMGDTFIMHPVRAAELRAELDQRARACVDHLAWTAPLWRGYFGGISKATWFSD